MVFGFATWAIITRYLQWGNWNSISKGTPPPTSFFGDCPLSTVVQLKIVVITHRFQRIESISMQMMPSYLMRLTDHDNKYGLLFAAKSGDWAKWWLDTALWRNHTGLVELWCVTQLSLSLSMYLSVSLYLSFSLYSSMSWHKNSLKHTGREKPFLKHTRFPESNLKTNWLQ